MSVPGVTRRWSAAACWLLCASSFAGAPRVLDVIPEEGILAVVAVDDLTVADGRLGQLLRSIRGTGYAGIRSVLETMGLHRGVDRSGSAALLLMRAGEGPLATWLLIAPVTDSEEFYRGAGAGELEGMRSFEYAGSLYHSRSIDDRFIIIGPEQAAVEAFDGNPGRSGRHAAWAGSLGRGIMENADMVALIRAGDAASVMRYLVPLLMREGSAGAIDDALRADPLAVRSDGASFFDRLMRLVGSETRSTVMGLTFDEDAARLDIASAFAPDGVLARATAPVAAGDPPASALSIMPDEPFLLAIGIDAAHHFVHVLADELSVPGRVRGNTADMERRAMSALGTMESLGLVVYTPPSVMFGSLSRLMVGWQAPAPEEAVAPFRLWIESLNGQPLGNGTISARYDASPGVEARDSWVVTPPNGGLPMLGVLMGPLPDVQGTTLRFADRAYLTWTRDAGLINRTARRTGPSLSDNAAVARASSRLPSPGVIEAYLDVGPLVRQLAPMIIAAEDRDELPDEFPPISASLVVGDGSAQVSMRLPKEALHAMMLMTQGRPDQRKGR